MAQDLQVKWEGKWERSFALINDYKVQFSCQY